MKYISSTETHKKFLINEEIFSPIIELYDDPEVCEFVNCNLIKSVQPFSVMDFDCEKTYDISYYSKKYRSLVFEFIKGNKTINEVIKDIVDLTKFYHLSLNPNDSLLGLITCIVFCLVLFIMILSILFLYNKKYQDTFILFEKDFWLISILGCIILLSSILTFYGEASSFKCHLRRSFISVGFVCSVTPILYRLISDYPKPNAISLFVKNYKFRFFIIIMMGDLFLVLLLGLIPYDIRSFVIINGENFHKCEMRRFFGKMLIFSVACYEIVCIILIIYLVIKEWKSREKNFEKKFFVTAVSVDAFSIVLYHIFSMILIKNYIAYNTLLITITFIFTISKYICIYGIRIISIFIPTIDKDSYYGYILTNNDKKNELFYNNGVSYFSTNIFSNEKAAYTSLSNKIFDFQFDEKGNSSQTLNSDITEYIHEKKIFI